MKAKNSIFSYLLPAISLSFFIAYWLLDNSNDYIWAFGFLFLLAWMHFLYSRAHSQKPIWEVILKKKQKLFTPRVIEMSIDGHGFIEDVDFLPPPFHVVLVIIIGFEGYPRFDTRWEIDLCDKTGMQNEIERYFTSEFWIKSIDMTTLRRTLVVQEYDKYKVRDWVTDFVSRCEGRAMREVWDKLSEELNPDN